MNIEWNKDVIYNAVWSLLAEVDRHNRSVDVDSVGLETSTGTARDLDGPPVASDRRRIRSILMPALGTGTGAIPYARFTAQFTLAVKNFDESVRNPTKWANIGWDDVQTVTGRLGETWREQQ